MPRVVVVHATNLLQRGFLTSAPDRTRASDGSPTNAIFASTRAILTALAFKEPSRAVAILDAEIEPEALPAPLRSQLARLPEALGALGLPMVEAVGARHVVASYAHAALDAGHDVVVVGSDKRLAQLVGDRLWWYDPFKDVRYTPDMVRKRFEVGPEKVAEWLALVGDDDALPGVKGIGKKGATRLLERFGEVAEALARVDEISGRTGNALRAALEQVPRELERARLERDRPLPEPLEELAWRAPREEALQALYRELGFLELLETQSGAPIDVAICESSEALEAALAAFDERPVALASITGDPSPVRGELVGLAIAQTEGPALYVPLAGREIPAPLAALLQDEGRPKTGHDVKAATVAFAKRGVAVKGIVADVACASHLHEPSNLAPQDLPILTRHYLHRALPEEDAVRGVGRRRKAWARVEPERAAEHAGARAEAAAALWERLEPTTDRALLDEYLALSEVLVGMELRGIAVDGDDLAAAGEDFARIRGELEEEIHALAGRLFNVNSTKQLGAVLFEELGLEVVSRTKTGWSTATWALERIAGSHPIVPLVIRWRLLRRLEDTWVTALGAAIDEDGRVRSTFHPARSFSGRLVNANPDLGRVPGQTEEMQRIRHAFAAPEGRALLSVDYRQLGLYVLAHLTEDPALVEPLARDADMHTLTAAAVLELDEAQVGRDARQLGKVVNFATFAGQGASALAQQLGVSAQEAKAYIARFDRRYAKVRAFQDEQLRLARDRGYIETITGRRWPIGGLRSPDPMHLQYAERLARRATHEASVADVSRRGLLRAATALRESELDAFPLLQVHDEVLFEVAREQLEDAARVASGAMRTAFALRVPLRVGCKAGPKWADLEPLTVDSGTKSG